MAEFDWRARLEELSKQDWDPETQFVGIRRLGDSYHPVEPFLKFNAPTEDKVKADRVFYPVYGISAGLYSHLIAQRWARKPAYSQLPKLVLMCAFGCAFGEYFYKSQQTRLANKDAHLIHYILLHEEDFPRIRKLLKQTSYW